MFDEDIEIRKKKAVFSPANLEKMSIDEINDYMDDLDDEIYRCKKDIVKKKSHMESASSFFR